MNKLIPHNPPTPPPSPRPLRPGARGQWPGDLTGDLRCFCFRVKKLVYFIRKHPPTPPGSTCQN